MPQDLCRADADGYTAAGRPVSRKALSSNSPEILIDKNNMRDFYVTDFHLLPF